MIVLGIETSGDTASVALCAGDRLIASRAFPSRMSLCQRLASEIEAVLGDLGDGRLGGVAVSRGPGSFTSLRVGLVTAKALTHRLSIPLAGVPTPEAVAWPFAHERGRTIAVVLPAWRSALYVATYRSEASGRLRAISGPAAMEPAEMIQHFAGTDGELLLVGEGAVTHRETLREAIGERAGLAPEALGTPDARFVAAAARPRLAQPDPDAAFRLRPLYVVPSQAERVAGIDLGLTGTEDLM